MLFLDSILDVASQTNDVLVQMAADAKIASFDTQDAAEHTQEVLLSESTSSGHKTSVLGRIRTSVAFGQRYDSTLESVYRTCRTLSADHQSDVQVRLEAYKTALRLLNNRPKTSVSSSESEFIQIMAEMKADPSNEVRQMAANIQNSGSRLHGVKARTAKVQKSGSRSQE